MKYSRVVVELYWKQMGLPAPVAEYVFAPPRKFRFDFAWPDQRLYLECDGGIWIRGGHNRGAQMLKDWEKRNIATINGWRGLWCEPKQICTAEMVETIRKALEQPAARDGGEGAE